MTGALRVGFVGLGSQGAPIARRIIDAGFATTLWARRAASLDDFSGSGADVAASLRDLGGASDVLCICVVSDADVDEVLRGADGALAGMSPDGVVLLHSTVHPDTCRRLQSDHPSLHVLDAPVSGGGHRAASGELLVMVGGDRVVFDRCRPVLETFANPLVHLGPLGCGQEAKLLNNALFTAQLGLVADAFTIAGRRGMDLAGLTRVLLDGSGRSYAAEIISGMGYDLGMIAAAAGPLLTKDVGILAELLSPETAHLVEAADTTVDRMTALPHE